MKYKRILEKKEMRKKIVGWIVISMGVGMLILPDYENWKADCQEQARILAFLQKNTPEDCSNGMQERGDYQKKIKAVKRNLLYRRKLRKTKAEYSHVMKLLE